MRATAIASLLTVLSASAGLAAECPVDQAIYTQKTEGWVLTIRPPGEGGAANQYAVLRIEAPNGIAPFEGGIYQPNGFGSSMASLSHGCPPDAPEAEECRAYDGTIYALGPDGMEMFPIDFEDRSGPTPLQVLLPDFAAGVWYSQERDKAFTETGGPEDVFTHTACAS